MKNLQDIKIKKFSQDYAENLALAKSEREKTRLQKSKIKDLNDKIKNILQEISRETDILVEMAGNCKKYEYLASRALSKKETWLGKID